MLDFIHFYMYNIKAVKFSTQHPCHFGGQKTRRRCFRMAVGNYEAMLVFSVKESEDAAKALVEKFKALVEKNA